MIILLVAQPGMTHLLSIFQMQGSARPYAMPKCNLSVDFWPMLFKYTSIGTGIDQMLHDEHQSLWDNLYDSKLCYVA